MMPRENEPPVATPERARMVEAAARLLAALSDEEQAAAWRLAHGQLRCSVPRCPNRRAGYNSLCSGHIKRVQRHGDVLAHIPLRKARRPAPASTSDEAAA